MVETTIDCPLCIKIITLSEIHKGMSLKVTPLNTIVPLDKTIVITFESAYSHRSQPALEQSKEEIRSFKDFCTKETPFKPVDQMF